MKFAIVNEVWYATVKLTCKSEVDSVPGVRLAAVWASLS